MKHLTLQEKYDIIKSTCVDCEGIIYSTNDIPMVGIHNYGLLHDIADKLGMKGNSGGNLHSLWARITKIMRDLIKAGYPIREYKIKTCSWSEKETWHSCFGWL